MIETLSFLVEKHKEEIMVTSVSKRKDIFMIWAREDINNTLNDSNILEYLIDILITERKESSIYDIAILRKVYINDKLYLISRSNITKYEISLTINDKEMIYIRGKE